MLVFAGRCIAVEKQEFAAQQAHAVGAKLVQGFDVFAAFYVGKQFNFFVVLGLGGGFFELVERALLAAVAFLLMAILGEHQFIGSDDERAADAVHNHPFVFANQPPRRAQPNHGWNVETAPEYGGVAGGTAHVGGKAFYALVFEVDGVGGG